MAKNITVDTYAKIDNDMPLVVDADSYRIRLMSDDEILSKSEIIFKYDDLISKNYTLDSSSFGVTNLHSECSICGGDVNTCPGHMGAIVSPFPFVKDICINSFKTIIELLCPVCSHIPLPESLCWYIEKYISPDARLKYCQKRISEYKSNVIICPICKNKITLLKVIQKEPLIYVGAQVDNNNEPVIINPLALQAILNNFTQYDAIGWPHSYCVGNFMTNIIPIIPNKLRIKSIDNAVSIITTFYKNIVEEIVPELGKIYKILNKDDLIYFTQNSLFSQFQTLYNRLMAYYMLITDATSDSTVNTCLNIANKNDRKHFDPGVSAMGRLKGKEDSMFGKGIKSTRVDVSCRTVLGGAPDSKIMELYVPQNVANKLTMKFNVYEENIKAMQQLVACMSDVEIYNNINYPHVLFVEDKINKFKTKIDPTNAQTKASLLKPGDKLEISLIDGYFIMHCRFPSIREESWTSQRVHRSDVDIVSIPLSICEMKAADFDGDESQIYVNSNTCYQLEALLLHSCARMLVAYKDGNFAMWYSADTPYGIKHIKRGKNAIIKDYKYTDLYDVIQYIESFIPSDFNYKDKKTEIKNGKFVGDKTELNNKDMMLYMNDLYGPTTTLDFMDVVIKTAHDLNRNEGSTLGFEVRYYDKETEKKVKEIRRKLYEKVIDIEKSNNINRGIQELNETQVPKSEVQKLLDEQAKNSTIYNLGFLPKFLPEYSHVINQLDHILDETGSRFRNVLAENSRALCSFPKYSVDPAAYGYVKNGYADDISPSSHFYDCKSQRFSLYTKSGAAIGKQGYLQKRLAVRFNGVYADFNHALVDNNRLISLVVGACGCDPRKHIKQPLYDMELSDKEFANKYKEDKRLIELHKEITEWNLRWSEQTSEIKIAETYNTFATGFNWTQYCEQNAKTLSDNKKSDKSYRQLIEKFINEINEICLPSGVRTGIWSECYQLENNKHHEYFFRIMFGFKYELTNELFDKLLTYFEGQMCEGGEPLGIKSANSVSEPMSQLVLKAIHGGIGGASKDHVKRMGAFDAFETLLGGRSSKGNVLTFGLYDDSLEASTKWAEAQETFYINDIWTRAEIVICNNVDKKVVEMYKDELDFTQFDINPTMININIDVTKIAEYNIHVVDIINKLSKSYQQILFIAGYVLNANEVKLLVYFRSDITYDTINIILEEWGSIRNTRTLVHGGYLTNCYVAENKNIPGHYLIIANEIDVSIRGMENLIFNPEVDPYKCSSSNIDTMFDLFGCCEACVRHIAESQYTAKNISATSGVLVNHYKLIADNSFSTGKFLTADRYSLKEDVLNDPFNLISYETPKDFINTFLKVDKTYKSASLIASTFFGGKSANFSGDMVSKITLYEKHK